MWGAPSCGTRFSTFLPLTMAINAQNNSESLALAAKFSREVTGPAGSSWTPTGMCCCPLSFYTAHRLTGQLTGVIGLTLWGGCFQMHESVVRGCNSGMEYERKKQRHPAVSAPCLQLLLPRTDTQQGESSPALKQAAHLPSPHLVLMAVAGYNQ